MDLQIKEVLRQDRTIDITTIGRKTAKPRRIEIWFHNLDDHIYITGIPHPPRSWYANLLANPEFTFHLKQSVQIDLAAKATPILDKGERRRILQMILENIKSHLDDATSNLEVWVENSPLVEVIFD